jgi:NAD(P)-dependent dehydrogenase (short-subunit alcohol dehydrogenase family)
VYQTNTFRVLGYSGLKRSNREGYRYNLTTGGNKMELNFCGKQVVVTGGANGIGLAISRSVAANGGSVWMLDLPGRQLEEAARSAAAQACPVDVTDRESIRQAFGRVDRVDVAIVNAGIGETKPLVETAPDLWDRTIATNLSGAFYTLQAAAERMKVQGQGAIVLTASTNSYDGEADLIAYNASKAGLLGLLHTAANELGPYGIRVNAVCPGLIRTRLTASSFGNPTVLSEYFKHIPLGRGGEPEEVAQAVLFLASDLGSYITGAALLVDGGQMASKFGTWGQNGDTFDGQRWSRLRFR